MKQFGVPVNFSQFLVVLGFSHLEDRRSAYIVYIVGRVEIWAFF